LVDDGGSLQMLNSRYPDLPLLVLTFNDYEKAVRKNIDSPDSGFEMLLQRISDPSKRQRARGMMVRLSNNVSQTKDRSIIALPSVDQASDGAVLCNLANYPSDRHLRQACQIGGMHH
jgi:hypothetical protein